MNRDGRGAPRSGSVQDLLQKRMNYQSSTVDYLNQKPNMRVIEKEITNNRIKIMNMKTDYNRMKKLILKIRGKSAQAPRKTRRLQKNYGIYEQQSSSL